MIMWLTDIMWMLTAVLWHSRSLDEAAGSLKEALLKAYALYKLCRMVRSAHSQIFVRAQL
jgi:hypothetical protein